MIQEFPASSSSIKENPTSNSIAKIPIHHLSNFVSLKLTEDNFITWKSLMFPVISKYKLMKFLDGSYPCLVQYTSVRKQANDIENPLCTDWIDEDATIIMWIQSTLSESTIKGAQR